MREQEKKFSGGVLRVLPIYHKRFIKLETGRVTQTVLQKLTRKFSNGRHPGREKIDLFASVLVHAIFLPFTEAVPRLIPLLTQMETPLLNQRLCSSLVLVMSSSLTNNSYWRIYIITSLTGIPIPLQVPWFFFLFSFFLAKILRTVVILPPLLPHLPFTTQPIKNAANNLISLLKTKSKQKQRHPS